MREYFAMGAYLNSIGKCLEDVIVEIVNGEIQVSGPNVMMGYWNNEIASSRALEIRNNRVWYKTGDSGSMKDDFLYYHGRISENYKLSNGKFVNVNEVENIIKQTLSETVLLGDGVIGPSVRAVKLCDDETAVFKRDLVNPIFVGVQRGESARWL